MSDTVLESEFQDFLQAAVDFVGGVPEFARRFDLDPSAVHKMLRGQLRPQPSLLAKLRIEEIRVYILPPDGVRWYESYRGRQSSAQSGSS